MCVVSAVDGELQGSLSWAIQDAIREFAKSFGNEGDVDLAWYLSFEKLPGVQSLEREYAKSG